MTEAVPATRRRLLGVAAALAAVALPAAAADAAAPDTAAGGSGADADAELLRLVAEMTAIKHESDTLNEQAFDLAFDDPQRGKMTAHANDIMKGWYGLRARVVFLPARTRAGLVAKARMAMDLVSLNGDGTPIDDEALYWSVLRDVLAEPAAKP